MKSAQDIIETNRRQKEFYNNIKQNFFTRKWAGIRNGILNRIRKNIGIQDQAYALHKQWFGDLSNKKVLDLGCFSGNYWSGHLAQHAKMYVGIDLSDVAISKLAEKIKAYPNARAEAVDFLSDEFRERDFDLIYAYGVLHHFENTDILIARLKEVLKQDGEIISYDPLQTSLPIKILRMLYRPFQSDSEWEWPFSRKTYSKFAQVFNIKERRGVLGNAKWIPILNLLPLSKVKRNKIALKWHSGDWNNSAISDKSLFRCMHITMLMANK